MLNQGRRPQGRRLLFCSTRAGDPQSPLCAAAHRKLCQISAFYSMMINFMVMESTEKLLTDVIYFRVFPWIPRL